MSDICVSIVSHGQGKIANLLLDDLDSRCSGLNVVLTKNIPEELPIRDRRYPFLQIENPSPKGFAANHNQAFRRCDSGFFCVANPDIRLQADPFGHLKAAMSDPRVGLVAPLIVNPGGTIEDSARYFPTPFGLLRKALGKSDGRFPIDPNRSSAVDWTAGMFMFFRSEAFAEVGGFDEGFFLYYEDVDICARLWKAGWKVILQPTVSVVHDARRTSHADAKYMRWHVLSMMRYFTKHLGRTPNIRSMS
ncbi:glycosyltransferase [Rhizobium leguminosarum bv. viciae]|uniref:glycosyltransferase n=1 Tax=Rhizobium leguminosarum TaxID=384 RepID=UPI00140F60F9|nr:glycosyltransferase family 2 protein [Rhizobium leguminosarum]NKJ91428.1 glycosyltransferase [Rhizobium leguminosarum bv. viciae]QIO58433.1 glycosyltransferase family 2 protein [Rhizobium leguminosarum bv. trifolii]